MIIEQQFTPEQRAALAEMTSVEFLHRACTFQNFIHLLGWMHEHNLTPAEAIEQLLAAEQELFL